MDSQHNCKYCENLDPTHNKCSYRGIKCLTLGNEETTYQLYKEVDQEEKERRDSIYQMQEQAKETHKREDTVDKALNVIHAVFLWAIIILTLISVVLMLVYRFKHPELTETQLFIQYMQNWWWLYIIIIIEKAINSNFR